MTEKRFTRLRSYLGMYTIFDNKEGRPLSYHEVIELLERYVND